MKWAVWLCRLILGSTFMLSGLTKVVDPMGTLIKIQAYLAAWDWSVPRGITFMGGCLLAMVEFISGFLVATGSLRRTSVWVITAIMAFMLPFTAYIAIANPVDDCGCFGDFLVISNAATFIKNLILMAMAIFLVMKNRRCACLFSPWCQWIQVTFAVAYLFVLAAVGYTVQPLLDFRAYPVGQPIADTAGADMRYIYKAPDGTTGEFTEDNLPDESDGWEYVDAKQIAPASGKMLALFDRVTGADVTDQVLCAPQLMLFLFPEPSGATAAGSYTANELNQKMTERYGSGAFAGITCADSAAVEMALDLLMADYPVYYADPKAIKTLARGDMAVVYLRHDTVMWKRTLSSINLDRFDPQSDPAMVYDTHSSRFFNILTLIFIAAEGFLLLICVMPKVIRKLNKLKKRNA